ncbi:MAG: acyl-ACP--UDP-N-acetylglucosamine O-acyltransferase [Tepidisphaeraceae bacterium]|jgi:UDP-N-acetylglucosamine acyltransferase
MANISPHSCVDPKAELAADVEVGPFCQIGPEVVLGRGCRLLGHVVITGRTKVGAGNVFHPNSALGGPPQDKKYAGEATGLEIGDGNDFREGVTVHVGTATGSGCTRIGDDNLLMANCHLGHDVQMGSHCVVANNVMIAGHVACGNYVHLMGGAGVHHFVTIGSYAFIGGAARIHHDVPPFVKVDGADKVRGLNSVGLQRAGFSQKDIDELEEACRRLFYRRKPFAEAMGEFDTLNGINPHIKELVDFLRRRDQGKHGRYLERFRPEARANPA